MKFAIPALIFALVIFGLMAVAFQMGRYVQTYQTLLEAGREPYASFEQVSDDGRLRAECDVYKVEGHDADMRAVEYK